ncbi:MAG: hypothetical protein JSV91_13365 [Phycisphaerales bacterium]|nr:MAG: hypothetical protein JSV91_13365 [Phycisphaerales bacterium]
MALIEINRTPSRRELNWFGLIFALFFGIVGGLIYWRFKAPATAMAMWIAAGGITVLYYLIPPLRRPVYLGWLYAAFPIGWVVSHVLMAAIYFLVFLPIGLVMRLLGYDPMHRRFDPDAESYWVEHNPAGDASRYFRQF